MAIERMGSSGLHTRPEVMIRRAISGARFAASGSVIPKPSWTQAAWFIDPANVTGLASDNNDGKTSLTPVRTWNGGVLRRYGTYSPRLRQDTLFTFLSSHTDSTDPVVFRPLMENAQITIQGALPTASATGVLGVVTAKNSATNTLLSAATIPGTGAVGQLLVNTTRANSRAWVEKSLGAGAFQLSQPFAPAVVPLSVAPVENNAWATGDTVQVFSLVAVNIVDVEPVQDFTTVFINTYLAIYQLTIFDPASSDPCNVNCSVVLVEVNAVRGVALQPSGIQPALFGFWHSCGFQRGIKGGSTVPSAFAAAPNLLSSIIVNGGYILFSCVTSMVGYDGDVIIGTNATAFSPQLGLVAVDTGSILNVWGLSDFRGTSAYASHIIYGAGTLNVIGASKLGYPAGAGGAVAAFKLTPRINLNGVNTGHSVITGAPDVSNGGIAITAAALDAAAGVAGFGGSAFNYDGASIANTTL